MGTGVQSEGGALPKYAFPSLYGRGILTGKGKERKENFIQAQGASGGISLSHASAGYQEAGKPISREEGMISSGLAAAGTCPPDMGSWIPRSQMPMMCVGN